MTDGNVEGAPQASDAELYDYVAAMASEMMALLAGRRPSVVPYLLSMVTLEAKTIAAAEAGRAHRRASGEPSEPSSM